MIFAFSLLSYLGVPGVLAFIGPAWGCVIRACALRNVPNDTIRNARLFLKPG